MRNVGVLVSVTKKVRNKSRNVEVSNVGIARSNIRVLFEMSEAEQ